MDSLLIKGSVPLHGEVADQRGEERRAADHGGHLAYRRTLRDPAGAEPQRCEVHGPNSVLARRARCASRVTACAFRLEDQGHGGLRFDPEDARLDLRHGPAAGPVEAGRGVAARRLCDRRPAHQPALERIRSSGGKGDHRERICPGPSQTAGRHPRCFWAAVRVRRCLARPT